MLRGPVSATGDPTWLVYDPVCHRYFALTQSAFRLLVRWEAGTLEALATATSAATGEIVNVEDVEALLRFAEVNNFLDEPPGGDSANYVARARAGARTWFTTAIHSYLFFRIPLFRPDRTLRRTYRLAAPFLTRGFARITALCGVAGIYLVSRQWDTFAGTFLHFISLEGAIWYALSLVVIKTLHELGHAYAAVGQGVRVNTMGIAFLVMMPVAYTDVSDAWRLRGRRARLAIDAAGILTELAIASYATLAWAFLPDGPARSIAFFLATASWLLTLLINLNPLMRFDGYHLLADAWGIANLQNRSNALAKWAMRKRLFGLAPAPPESFRPRTEFWLIVYAYAVWIYRFFLFLAIALLVYHLFFKLLGVVLFVIEIVWFIALPIVRELMEWWKMRHQIVANRRSWTTGAIVAGLAGLAFIPWHGTVRIPAVLAAPEDARIFAPTPARIAAIHVREGVSVIEGTPILTLSAPALEHEHRQSARRIELYEARLRRLAGDRIERASSRVLKQTLAAERARLAGIEAELARLQLRATRAGIVRDMRVDLHLGLWVPANEPLADVVPPGLPVLRGLLPETEVSRLTPGARGIFIPDDLHLPKLDVTLVSYDRTALASLESPYLASEYGGPVPVHRMADRTLRPVTAHVRVRFRAQENVDWPAHSAVRGVVRVEGRAESFARTAARQVMRVFVREAGL